MDVRRNCRLRVVWDGGDKVEATSVNMKNLPERHEITGDEKPNHLASICDMGR